MEIVLAKTAGFCFGVKRAVDTVYSEIEKGGKIYTFGPIIHNETVVDDLADKGVQIIRNVDDIEDLNDCTVIIRSHGISKEIYEALEKKNLNIVDATCPFVKKIHRIVAEESNNGKLIIVIGNSQHPEVEGIIGWCNKNNPAVVIENKEQAEVFCTDKKRDICIVSQTTFNYNKFQELVEIFTKKGYDVNVVNTICNATE